MFIFLQIFCHARKNERNVCERLTVCCLGGASSSSATTIKPSLFLEYILNKDIVMDVGFENWGSSQG